MSLLPHNDSGADHAKDLVNDLFKHTPDERAHLISGLFEKGASEVLKVAGTLTGDPTLDAASKALAKKADTDIAQGHLNFQDYFDIYKTIDHFN